MTRNEKSLQALFNSNEPGWCFIFGTDKASVFEKDGRYMVEYSYGNQVSDPEYFDDEETAKEYAIDLSQSRRTIKSSTGTIHCVYLSDIVPTEWTKDMALAAIKNSVTNYGYYEYNGKKGLCIVGDFEDIYNFIESVGHTVDEDDLYHWKEFPWDNAKKLDTIRSSHRPIKSESDMIDVILDEIDKIIREECKGMEITDRTELFTGGLYNVAKKRLTDRLISFMV